MKSFFMFIFGAIVGAAGGVLVTKYICDAKSEAKIAAATAEARNFYKDRYEKDVNEKADKLSHETLAKVYQHDNPGTTDRIWGNTYNVSQLSRNPVDYRSVESDPNKNKPYQSLVDPNDLDAFDNYEQYSLDYYQDGTLVDEAGNPIDNPLEIAGDFLDELSLTNPEIYVSNDVTKTVYDICYVAASFDQPGGEYD
jgi:hypothetical protein